MAADKTTGVRILGIESSCDETAAALVVDGRRILSSVVASQIDIHRKYGGVVPELASREHLRQIVPVVREALAGAELRLDEVDAIAVTQGPGLVGSLLVGITYGKTLAEALATLFRVSTPAFRLPTLPPATSPGPTDLRAREALDHYDRAIARLKAGDWAGFGAELDAMRPLLEQLSQPPSDH